MINTRWFVALLVLLPLCGQAEGIDYTVTPASLLGTSLSAVQHTDWLYSQPADTAEDRVKRTEQLARLWNITSEEWTRYETIMQGEGRYHWKDVDPIMVLGIYARNAQERARYAAMMAKKEHRLQGQFITFNQAYMKAFDEQFGAEPIIDLAAFYEQYRKSGLASSIQTASQPSVMPDENTIGDRYVLFLNTQCARCDEWFRRIRTQQAMGTTLDVYFIGESKESIGSWATGQVIEPSDLQGGTMTLNQDNGMYTQYGRPALPAAYYYDDSSQSTLQIQEEGATP